MTKLFLTTALFLAGSTTGYAHPTHIAEQAGHSHWLAWIALALALKVLIVSLILAWQRRSRQNPLTETA